MATIEAVTFDLWQTLLIDYPEWGIDRRDLRIEGTQRVLRESGEEFRQEHLAEAYQQCLRACGSIKEKGYDVSFRERIRCFIDSIDQGLGDRLPEDVFQTIADVYANSFYWHPPLPHRKAANILAELKAGSYPIGLISNTDSTPGTLFRDYMERLDLLKYFDVLTFSDEAGYSKPATEIFTMTTRLMGVDPARTVHVGDHFANDVVGAQQVGMKAIWINLNDAAATLDQARPDATIADLGEAAQAVQALAGGASGV